MKFINNIKSACKEVYSSKGYWFLTIGFAIFLFSMNAVVRNFSLLKSNFSFQLLFSLIKGIQSSFSFGGLLILILTSILAGIVISMSAFLIKRQIQTSVSAGTGSILIAILAPACPSCAIGLFAVFGLGGFLAFLPFKGLEIGILGVIVILLSISYLSKKIVTNVCEIK